LSLLTPDRYYTNVEAIDLEDLRRLGVEGQLLDMDNTILPRDTSELRQELRDWATRTAEDGFRLCLVSNNWHGHVSAVAEQLGIPLVARAVKPLPFAFLRGMRLLGVDARRAAVIGDQLFTDVLGGNLVGATTVLVDPLSRSDLPHTLLLRLIEARIMADRKPTA
jgi:HAD superfamily phosphatase (TIGR01668 family)